jgi:hypothetical protein
MPGKVFDLAGVRGLRRSTLRGERPRPPSSYHPGTALQEESCEVLRGLHRSGRVGLHDWPLANGDSNHHRAEDRHDYPLIHVPGEVVSFG